MKYLKVSESKYISNDFKVSFLDKILNKLLSFVSNANPDYEEKFNSVSYYFIEFIKEYNDEFLPYREIAFDKDNNILFAGPDENNYGYWLDTNLKFTDFLGETISKSKFEKYWLMSGVKELD